MKRLIYLVFILLIMISTIILFAACDLLIEDLLGLNCDSEMEDIREERGEPDEVNQYDYEDYHSVEWCYWSQRICYKFEWGETVSGCHVYKSPWDPRYR